MRRFGSQDGSLTCANGKRVWDTQRTSRWQQDDLLGSDQPAPQAELAAQPHPGTARCLRRCITGSVAQGATDASWRLPALRFRPNRRGIVQPQRFGRNTPRPRLRLMRHAAVRSRDPPAEDSFNALPSTRSGGCGCAECGPATVAQEDSGSDTGDGEPVGRDDRRSQAQASQHGSPAEQTAARGWIELHGYCTLGSKLGGIG